MITLLQTKIIESLVPRNQQGECLWNYITVNDLVVGSNPARA